MPTEDTFWKRLLASNFSSALREEWFSSYEFFSSIWILDIKYRHSRSKYKSSFYPFNDQFDYIIAYYFAKSEIAKGNMKKFLTDPLMVPLTKKLSHKNADE